MRVGLRALTLGIQANAKAFRAAKDSEAHFFKEQSWGLMTDRNGRCIHYEGQHPVWDTYEVTSYTLDWDAIYGPDWAAYSF